MGDLDRAAMQAGKLTEEGVRQGSIQTHRDVGGGIHFPQQVVPAGTTRHGLVIGIDNYADARLNLRCAVADAKVLRDLMVDPECGCFPPDNVQLLLDHEATHQNIWRALSRLRRQAAENDMVWIYYAGHAAVEDRAYWVTHDADVDDDRRSRRPR